MLRAVGMENVTKPQASVHAITTTGVGHASRRNAPVSTHHVAGSVNVCAMGSVKELASVMLVGLETHVSTRHALSRTAVDMASATTASENASVLRTGLVQAALTEIVLMGALVTDNVSGSLARASVQKVGGWLIVVSEHAQEQGGNRVLATGAVIP